MKSFKSIYQRYLRAVLNGCLCKGNLLERFLEAQLSYWTGKSTLKLLESSLHSSDLKQLWYLFVTYAKVLSSGDWYL